jgi:hypothetical protein
MIVDLSRDIFSCGTHVFVYVLIHVMCLCVYVSMVCQRCMLYDDMYSHNTKFLIYAFIEVKCNQIRALPNYLLYAVTSGANFPHRFP